MGRLTINLPRLGETMEEARVTAWIVAPNAAFKRGDILLEVETDKTVVEVPALQDGIMLAHLVAEGDVVALEAPIAEIEAHIIAAIAVLGTAKTVPNILPEINYIPQGQPEPVVAASANGIAASPAARAMARQMNVPLFAVSGTGRNGRITANDVEKGQCKTTVVLLHGLFDNHRGWRDLPQRLMQAGHEIANIDLPGHGGLLPQAQDFEDAVQIISQHLSQTLTGTNVIIVGHSLGAALGASVAAELQKLRLISVKGLLMLAPAGLGARINANFMDGMMAASSVTAFKNCLALLEAAPLSDAVLAAERDRLIVQRPAISALAGSAAKDGFQQVNIGPLLDTLKIPVIAVFGLKDQIINWQDCAALPQNIASHFLRDAGHLPHTHAPEFIVRLINSFNTTGLRPEQAG